MLLFQLLDFPRLLKGYSSPANGRKRLRTLQKEHIDVERGMPLSHTDSPGACAIATLFTRVRRSQHRD